jgi:hypothetical protein
MAAHQQQRLWLLVNSHSRQFDQQPNCRFCILRVLTRQRQRLLLLLQVGLHAAWQLHHQMGFHQGQTLTG